ncbi:Wall-associated receptor kinase-like 14 [Linum perenne]
MFSSSYYPFLFLPIIAFLINSFTLPAAAALSHPPSTAVCNTTCGGTNLQYPFGFSPGCHVILTCSPDGHISIGGFPVSSVDNSTIKINIQPSCHRPIADLKSLFAPNYAPKSTNAILLHSCANVSTCSIPTIDVQTHFEPVNCSTVAAADGGSLSCFSDMVTWNGLFNYRNMTEHTHCDYFMSSISVVYSVADNHNSGVSLEVQMMELEWWMDGGNCRSCSVDADCQLVNTTRRRREGHRCSCRKGFSGDGYRDGSGCRKERRLEEAKGIDITIYQYKEIARATNSFSDTQRLGTGAYGTVYSGKLHTNSFVAIKRIKNRDTESIDQVINEIKLISSVRHPNLVRLLGCSIEHGEQILVYEFMPNGTLSQHLHGERGEGLTWPVRLGIVTETAQAVAHLHSAIDPPIFHRDIKSSNILLDFNYNSKLADFGLSRLGMPEISHISTAPQGTPGYLDPQYHQNFHLSDKSDVYSFGVVLVEIITGRKAVDFSRLPSEINLANLAADRIGKGRLDEIMDPNLNLDSNSDDWTIPSIHRVAEIAFRCLAFERELRPSMMEIAAELEGIKKDQWGETSSLVNGGEGGRLSEVSQCRSSSSTNNSERPLSLNFEKAELQNRCNGLKSADISVKNYSPVSVRDPWLSEQSSSGSNSFQNNGEGSRNSII